MSADLGTPKLLECKSLQKARWYSKTAWQADRKTDRQTDTHRETSRPADKQADRLAGRHTYKTGRLAGRQTYRLAD